MSQDVRVRAHPGTEPTEGERLLRALGELCDEPAYRASGEEPHDAAPSQAGWPPISMPSKEDERFVVGLRTGLARLADSRRQKPGEGATSVVAALDGAQLAARCDILMGQTAQLRQLLPTFAYLVVLPVSGEAEALHVAERATRLLSNGEQPHGG
jgi:hypothetical protein